ncbi:pimeloyl-ACP methyl ester carboxylesterase [Actinoplanes teichomyceticus]|uniref:Pimeloyl-ACP methyl ester carboxylesterase n=2 Tax=Actinoplanes teichomyceticus TaxID=1867 RepID=A0A561VCT0_ACTTI|nr:pimeloyl-ACP methyl ester carboxylesterase [Actinoplanes teichomyceticus]
MDDGARLRTWTTGAHTGRGLPLVLLHGGPGLADHLAPVAALVDDLCPAHRYDQRGTGGSGWAGTHTIARHVRDLASLLDAWGHRRVILAGHSYGSQLAGYFLLAHPERVAGLIGIAPFLEPWRAADRAAQRARRTAAQQARLVELEKRAARGEAEEIEYLTLSWFTDHADPDRAWEWALASARALRPVNSPMNSQLNAATRADPLDAHVDELAARLPPGSMIVGGSGDSRPADALRRTGARLGCAVVIVRATRFRPAGRPVGVPAARARAGQTPPYRWRRAATLSRAPGGRAAAACRGTWPRRRGGSGRRCRWPGR